MHLHKYIPSTNPSRSSESSFSNDLGLAELIDHELKKTEKIKLGDLKQSIEENIIKINEDKEIDNDAKFNIMLCIYFFTKINKNK